MMAKLSMDEGLIPHPPVIRGIRFIEWTGAPPAPGSFLRAQGSRVRKAYRVLESHMKWSQADECWKGIVLTVPLAVGELPQDARVHETWSIPRKRKRPRRPKW